MTYLDVIDAYQSGQRVTIGLIHNSIGAGYYADNWGTYLPNNKDNPLFLSYANQLRAMLKAKNSNSDLVNISTSGWTTQSHINNDSVGILAAHNPKPSIVLLAVQINDYCGTNRTTWAAFQANTRAVVQDVLDNGMIPVLVKESDIKDSEALQGIPRTDGKVYLDFINEIDVVAGEKGCAVIDTYTPFNELFVSNSDNWAATGVMHDSIHPNQAGHNLIYDQYVPWFSQSTLYSSGDTVLYGGAVYGGTTLPISDPAISVNIDSTVGTVVLLPMTAATVQSVNVNVTTTPALVTIGTSEHTVGITLSVDIEANVGVVTLFETDHSVIGEEGENVNVLSDVNTLVVYPLTADVEAERITEICSDIAFITISCPKAKVKADISHHLPYQFQGGGMNSKKFTCSNISSNKFTEGGIN